MVAELCRRVGWGLEHEMLVPRGRAIEVKRGAERWRWGVAIREEGTDESMNE